MPDFNSHKYMLRELSKAQEADDDNRQRVREAHHFLDKRDGQWEPEIINQMSGRPRYTFDKTNPIIDAICGEIEQADFGIKVKPAGGDATKDMASTLDGMIRNISSMSNFENIINQSARSMVTGGFDGWRVVQRYADTDSFDQDLFQEPIHNWIDRVWFDVGTQKQDGSDSTICWVLSEIPKSKYEQMFPKGSGLSISNDRTQEVYSSKPEVVTIAEVYYRVKEQIELVKLSNGAVYEDNDEFRAVQDEFEMMGVTEIGRRRRDSFKVFMRKMDGGDWLDKASETVFNWIPVVPAYANYKLTENKVIYRGAVERLIDPQRVYNYAKSRMIEEGALAPRAKYWMTKKQAAGHTKQLQTMNTNKDPVQFYNHDPEAPGAPQQQGGAVINPGLQLMAESAALDIQQASGIFASNMGDNPGLQSGVAIEQLQNKGDTATIKYFKALEVAICHTARILVDAIPQVYDTQRQVRVLNEDDSFDMVTLNEQVFDIQTQSMITLEDVTKGKYDVTCSAGPAFQNRQEEASQAILEMAQNNPEILQLGMDVLLNNTSAPGMDLLQERFRKQLFQRGVIPEEQMTDDEKALLQQMQSQPQQPDAATLLAQAELMKGEADQMQAQIKQLEAQLKAQEASAQIQLKQQELVLREQELQLKVQQASQGQQLEQVKMAHDMRLETEAADVDNENTEADTLKKLAEARNIGSSQEAQ